MLTLTQVWGALLIFVVCPLLGALPLTRFVLPPTGGAQPMQERDRAIGIPTVFEAGGTFAGVLAIILEAAKGIGTVLLARYYFPADASWEVVALIALLMGRYWAAKSVGTTSILWGSTIHSPVAAGLTLLISFLGFTIFREKQQGRLLVLVLFPVITALSQQNGMQILLTACLCGLMGWIYQKVPEDLELPSASTRLESRRLFGFFRSDRALFSLDQALSRDTVGSKAATLAQLTAWDYPVPKGYVLPAGDDPAMLLEITRPSGKSPVIVRASAIGDNPLLASAAGQYSAVLDVTSQEALLVAINQVFQSYNRGSAIQYRRDRALPENRLAVIVQQQIQGLCSGVACSRDPFTCQGDAVIIEALLGPAQQVTSGTSNPDRYRVLVQENDLPDQLNSPDSWQLPEALTFAVEGTGDTPKRLLEEVAFLARHVERRYRGVPQVMEWSFDGDRLWLLQSRPLIPPSPDRPSEMPALPGSSTSLTYEKSQRLIGMPISPGQTDGKVIVPDEHSASSAISSNTILVVPHLKAHEVPALAQLQGLIIETGGQLSNGAIAAREYGLPVVLLMPNERPLLQSGQSIRLDGTQGLIELPPRDQ
ncbi:glycerol-3-phosphate acyltransferase [Oscillatoria sp. CS-180]|uniref:glycerol-3-phosphate acyltransferase n=1 Tax=Oscillatoria sp. CS-180 TaxID=3021720 RepID=UPI00232E2FF0|nr:glycerol-3-phosphate acyltransferase [Oscillatoria sp. CS-180]MDB9526849.1 glycerol-3-phosphate acyltransferase [Oscillatoria sp. CS-180]